MVLSYESFSYQAQSWDRPRRVVAKVEWHWDELFPRVEFIVTNMTGWSMKVVKFYLGTLLYTAKYKDSPALKLNYGDLRSHVPILCDAFHLLGVEDYKAFLSARRKLIATRLNEYLGG